MAATPVTQADNSLHQFHLIQSPSIQFIFNLPFATPFSLCGSHPEASDWLQKKIDIINQLNIREQHISSFHVVGGSAARWLSLQPSKLTPSY